MVTRLSAEVKYFTLQWTPGDSQNDPKAWDDYLIDPLDPISSIWPRPKLIPDKENGLSDGRPLGVTLSSLVLHPWKFQMKRQGSHRR